MQKCDDLKCATCGYESAALDLVHGDGVCAICGAAATNPVVRDGEPVLA